MSALLDRARRLRREMERNIAKAEDVHIVFDAGYQYTIHYLNEMGKPDTILYRPSPTGIKFHDDKKFVRAVVGPYASGKSVFEMSDMLLKFRDMPACKDGIKRRKSGMFRTTYNRLQTTTIETFMAWFRYLGVKMPGALTKFNKKELTFNIRFRYYDKERDEYALCEWHVIFLAFESESDGEKLGSLELTDCFFNEARDFHQIIFSLSAGRVGRYPAMKEFSDDPDFYIDYPSSVILDTNPCDNEHWFYNVFEVDRPHNYAIYHQPPAVLDAPDSPYGYSTNPDADNIRHLKPNYYLEFVSGKSKIFVDVYAKGLYGECVEGRKVFEEYNDDLHSSDHLDFTDGYPLYCAFDFGLTPCMVVAQFIDNQLRVIKEFVSESMGIENLIKERIQPYWTQYNMKRFVIASCTADPAGIRRNDLNVSLPTSIAVVTRDFAPTKPAMTNNIDIRLEGVRTYMNRMSMGKPSFIISRTGCPTLRKGFNGRYVLKSTKRAGSSEEMYDKIPDKSHPWSDPQDCLQYIALDINSTAAYQAFKESYAPTRPAINLYGGTKTVLGG